MADYETKKKDRDSQPEPAPENRAPEKKEPKPPEEITFLNARYPRQICQVPGRILREGVRFVDGRYTTSDPKEIEMLDKNPDAVREDS